jgi:hypothetical protein
MYVIGLFYGCVYLPPDPRNRLSHTIGTRTAAGRFDLNQTCQNQISPVNEEGENASARCQNFGISLLRVCIGLFNEARGSSLGSISFSLLQQAIGPFL